MDTSSLLKKATIKLQTAIRVKTDIVMYNQRKSMFVVKSFVGLGVTAS